MGRNQNSKKRRFWGTMALALLAIGCLKESHQVDESLVLQGPEGFWSVPLVSYAVSTNDIPAAFTEHLASNGPGASYVWSQALPQQAIGFDEWMTWPAASSAVSHSLSDDELTALNALSPGVAMQLEFVETIPFEGVEGFQIHKIALASGTLRCVASPLVAVEATTNFSFPEMQKDGQPLTFEITDGIGPVDVDLANVELLFPSSQPFLTVEALMNLQRTGGWVAQNMALAWQFEWVDVAIKRLEGQATALDPIAFEGELELASPAWLTGPMGLTSAALMLEIENQQGLGFEVDLSGQIHSSSGSSDFVWLPKGPAAIPAAPSPGTSASSTLCIQDDNTSPPMSTWIQPGLTGLGFEALLSISDDENQFITLEDSVKLRPFLEVPFVGFASQIEWADTMPINFQDVLERQLPPPLELHHIQRIELHCQVKNGLPLGLDAQVQFLDGEMNAVNELFTETTTLLQPAMTSLLNGVYVPVEPALSDWSLVFDGLTAYELAMSDVQFMHVRFIGQTSDGHLARPVAIGPNQGLELATSLRVETYLNQP